LEQEQLDPIIPSKLQIKIVGEQEIAEKAKALGLSMVRSPVRVERQHVQASDAAVVCRELEAYMKGLLPKEQCKNLQEPVPAAIMDREGRLLIPMGKMVQSDDCLSARNGTAKKTKTTGDILEHRSDYQAKFDMIHVTAPHDKSQVLECLTQVERKRAAFEARAEPRKKKEDKVEARPGNSAAVKVPTVKPMECAKSTAYNIIGTTNIIDIIGLMLIWSSTLVSVLIFLGLARVHESAEKVCDLLAIFFLVYKFGIVCACRDKTCTLIKVIKHRITQQ